MYCMHCRGQYTDGCHVCNPHIKIFPIEWDFTPAPDWIEFPVKTGWKCPVCGRGNSPSKMTCDCYRENHDAKISANNVNVNLSTDTGTSSSGSSNSGRGIF